MADFFQTGSMATLHRLGGQGLERLEEQLRVFVRDSPIALVLPCHIDELGTPALRRIFDEL
ncbi:MAG: glycosyl transferase, partial [Verrucomicrobiota bacterium]